MGEERAKTELQTSLDLSIQFGFECCDRAKKTEKPEEAREYLENARAHHDDGRVLLLEIFDKKYQSFLQTLRDEIAVIEKNLKTKEGTKILSSLSIKMARGIGLCSVIERGSGLNHEIDRAYREATNIHKKVLDAYKKDSKFVDIGELHCFVEKFSIATQKYDDLVRKSLE